MPIQLPISPDVLARPSFPSNPPDLFGSFFQGQDQYQKQQLQNLFRDPSSYLDAAGNLDYQKMARALLQAQGAPAVGTLTALRQADIQQRALDQNRDLPDPFGMVPQAPRPNPAPVSTSRPSGQATSYAPDQGTGETLRSDQPGNTVRPDEVQGSARISVDGGPALPLSPEPKPSTAYPPQFGQTPDTGPPTGKFTQVAQAQTAQAPVSDGRPPIDNQNDPGFWTLENARRYERAAYVFNKRAENLGIAQLPAGVAGPKQQAEQFGARAQQIYDFLSKSQQPTDLMKNAQAVGMTPTQFGEEEARRKEAGTAFAKRYEGITKAGSEAAAELPQLQVAARMMDDPRFMSGVGADVDLVYKRLLSQLGGDPNAAVPQEAFRKLVSNSLLENMRTMTGTGQLRVATIRIMQQAAANPENSVAANRLLVEMNRRLQERALVTMDLAQRYKGGRLDAGFDQQMTKYDQTHPLFSDKEIKDPRLIAPPLFRTPQEALYSGQPKGTPFRTPDGQIRYIP